MPSSAIHEVAEYCGCCIKGIARDPTTSVCEFDFNGRSKKCLRCKRLNKGTKEPCVAPRGIPKARIDELLATAKVVRDLEATLDSSREMQKEATKDEKGKLQELIDSTEEHKKHAYTIYKKTAKGFLAVANELGGIDHLCQMYFKEDKETASKKVRTVDEMPHSVHDKVKMEVKSEGSGEAKTSAEEADVEMAGMA